MIKKRMATDEKYRKLRRILESAIREMSKDTGDVPSSIYKTIGTTKEELEALGLRSLP